jgi:hypothetical protein
MSDVPIADLVDEPIADLVDDAREAVKTLVQTATETAQGTTELPAEIVENVAYATTQALDALTERVVAIEGKAGEAVADVADAPGAVVQAVAEPIAVPNTAKGHRGGFLERLR